MATLDQSEPQKQIVARRYSEKTLKILFAMSMNECAHPSCTQPIIQPRTEASDAAVIGQIAHIFAASDDGPRGKPGLTEKERNLPDNLILLCPTHHVVVDQQHETYPAPMLIEWRSTHERKFQEVLGAQISDVGFYELELTARSLMSSQSDASVGCLKTIPPDEKIKKNGLGGTSKMLLTMGAANSAEVEEVLLKDSQLDSEFADKLRKGFVKKYGTLFDEGLRGDDLFMAMYAWAGGASRDKAREASGLCILAHLFLICDVFEK